jgi:hypothetical protein
VISTPIIPRSHLNQPHDTDAGDDNGTSQFAARAVEVLIDILQDSRLNFADPSIPTEIPTSPVKDFQSSPRRQAPRVRSNAALRLSVTRDLWTSTRTAIPHNLLRLAGQKFIATLTQNENELVPETDSQDDSRKEWSLLCAEVLSVCDDSELQSFWGSLRNWTPEVRSLVWGSFVEKWTEAGDSWEGAAFLLSVPFA